MMLPKKFLTVFGYEAMDFYNIGPSFEKVSLSEVCAIFPSLKFLKRVLNKVFGFFFYKLPQQQ